MKQTYPTDLMVREIDSYSQYENDSFDETEKIIIIDAKSGEILSKVPLFKWARDIRYYWVSLKNKIILDDIKYQLHDFNTKYTVPIKIECEIKCLDEKRLVQSIYTENNPTSAIKKNIVNIIEEFQEETNDFLINYYDLVENFKKYIVKKIKDDLGIKMNINVAIDGEEDRNFKIYEVKSDFFPIRLNDYDGEVSLSFEIGLTILDGKKIYAVINQDKTNQLEFYLKEFFNDYFSTNISLHNFCFELNQSIRNKVVEILNEENFLNQIGRTVKYLNFDRGNIDIPPENIRLTHDVECKIKDCTVKVSHDLLMKPIDIGKYYINRINNLEEWIKLKLIEVTQDKLFEKSYADLIISFEEHDIKKIMKGIVESIGYEIKLFSVIPDLEPLKLKEEFRIEVNDEFTILDVKMPVKLLVEIYAKINDFQAIKEYLSPNIDLRAKIKESIYNNVSELVTDIDPERFYMRFYSTENENEKTVEFELIDKIRYMLENKFKLEVTKITPKQLDTDLITHFRKLIENGPYTVTIDVTPFRGAGREEKIKYEIQFDIINVFEKGWHIFQSKKFQSHKEHIEKIYELLKVDIEKNFSTVPTNILKYQDHKQLQELHKIASLSTREVKKTFGLLVRIVNLRRFYTEAENIADRIRLNELQLIEERETAASAIIYEEDLKSLKNLKERESDIIGTGDVDDDDQEELDHIRMNIDRLQEKISSYPIEDSTKEFKKLTNTYSADNFSFDDYYNDYNKFEKAIEYKELGQNSEK